MTETVIFVVLLAVVVPLIIGTIVVIERRRAEQWLEKWPPIDDDEFVRRCPPGVRRHTALTVRRILAEQLDIPYEHIHPEQSLIDDLEAG